MHDEHLERVLEAGNPRIYKRLNTVEQKYRINILFAFYGIQEIHYIRAILKFSISVEKSANVCVAHHQTEHPSFFIYYTGCEKVELQSKLSQQWLRLRKGGSGDWGNDKTAILCQMTIFGEFHFILANLTAHPPFICNKVGA